MNLLFLTGLIRRSPTPTPARPRPEPTAPAPGEEIDEGPPPCGWFDSSHALQRGLVVHELESPQALARAVPLDWWIEWACATPQG